MFDLSSSFDALLDRIPFDANLSACHARSQRWNETTRLRKSQSKEHRRVWIGSIGLRSMRPFVWLQVGSLWNYYIAELTVGELPRRKWRSLKQEIRFTLKQYKRLTRMLWLLQRSQFNASEKLLGYILLCTQYSWTAAIPRRTSRASLWDTAYTTNHIVNDVEVRYSSYRRASLALHTVRQNPSPVGKSFYLRSL